MRYSASKFNLYSDCSLKYKFIYKDNLKKPAISVHLAYGSSVHKGLEFLNKQLLNKKPDIEDMLQSYDDEWNKEISDMGLENDKYFVPKLYYHGLNTLINYYDNFIDYEVIGSEIEFEVPLPIENNTEDTLYGLIDAIIKQKDNIIIVDYKTSKETYNRFKLDTSIQLALYSYAFRHLLKEQKIYDTRKTKEDYIAYYVLLKDYETLNGDIKIQKKKITDKHIDRMKYIVDTSIKGINNNIFIPNYNSQCQWCEYKKECLEL